MQELCKKETTGCMSGLATKHICFCLWVMFLHLFSTHETSLTCRWCFVYNGVHKQKARWNPLSFKKCNAKNSKSEKRGWEQKIAIETALGSEQEVSLTLNSQSRLCHKDRQSYRGVVVGGRRWTDRKQRWHRAQEKTSFKVKAENNPKRLTGMNTDTYY